MNTIIECPKCQCQIQLKASFASGPRSKSEEKVFADNRDVAELLQAVNMEACTEWERSFITELRERYAKYKSTLRMSEKQMETLVKIAEKGF